MLDDQCLTTELWNWAGFDCLTCQRWQNYISNHTGDAAVSFTDNVIISLWDGISRYVGDAVQLSSYMVFILSYKMREMRTVGRKEGGKRERGRERKTENRKRNNRTR